MYGAAAGVVSICWTVAETGSDEFETELRRCRRRPETTSEALADLAYATAARKEFLERKTKAKKVKTVSCTETNPNGRSKQTLEC